MPLKKVRKVDSQGEMLLTERGHMFAGLYGQKANKRNLHARQCPQSVPSGVADIKSGAVPSHDDQNQGMHG